MKNDLPVPGKIKHKVSDFIVEEIGPNWTCHILEEFKQPKIEISATQDRKDFIWCEMEKQDIDHFQAIKEITYYLRKSLEAIGYAGTKDRFAHTTQRISIFKPDIELLKNFNHPKIILKNFKWEKRKIKIGYLEANHFKITVRDVDKKDAMLVSKKLRNTNWFPNYFGAQRFGSTKNNVNIGTLILKRKFKEAVEEICKDNFRQAGYFQEYLSKNKDDYIGAIKRADRKSMLMYLNSVQSQIFNEILERALDQGLDFTKEGQKNCLLVGYKTRFFEGGPLGEIEQQVLSEHKLTLQDFDIKEIPYLRIKGSFRKAITEVSDLNLEVSDDEEFQNSKKLILEFTLPSGVYATTFLENFFNFSS